MEFKNLTIFEFSKFVIDNSLKNHYQTPEYASFMIHNGYTCEFVGLTDNNTVIAASLLLIKKISLTKSYAYAPRGFILNYFNNDLFQTFTNKIKLYCQKKHIIFIKLNPEIFIAEYDYEQNKFINNNNFRLLDSFKNSGYQKLNHSKPFTSKLPEYSAIIELKKANYLDYQKNTRNKIRKSYKEGLSIEKTSLNKIEEVFSFIGPKKKKDLNYFRNYVLAFNQNNACDLFLIKINNEEYLDNLKHIYDQELDNNNLLVNKMMGKNNNHIIDLKIMSDQKLTTIKKNIMIATKKLQNNKVEYIASAITVKLQNRVYILFSGYNPQYKNVSANYFLHFKLIEYYKYQYLYLDLNGISGVNEKDNPYYGLDQFKLGFKPRVLQTIGEYDLIINKFEYQKLAKKGYLDKEFKRQIKSE